MRWKKGTSKKRDWKGIMKKTVLALTAIALITCGMRAYAKISTEANTALNQIDEAAGVLDSEMTRLKNEYNYAESDERKAIRDELNAFDDRVEQAEDKLDDIEDRWECLGCRRTRCHRCNTCQ